ncbi:hypothetical protein Hanom_Chr16g01463541 [Helianthus anomalus]
MVFFRKQNPDHGVVVSGHGAWLEKTAEHGAWLVATRPCPAFYFQFSSKIYRFMLIVLCFSFAELASKFTKFNTAEWDYQARYDILKRRPEETPTQVCLDIMEAMGQLDRYNTLVMGPLRMALGARLHMVHEYSM